MQQSKVKSMTDWERVKRDYNSNAPVPFEPGDEPYDPNDAQAVEAYWNQATIIHKGKVIRKGRGPQKSPTKERITIRLTPEVVEHFRSTGGGWQGRMDDALKAWIEQQFDKKRA